MSDFDVTTLEGRKEFFTGLADIAAKDTFVDKVLEKDFRKLAVASRNYPKCWLTL